MAIDFSQLEDSPHLLDILIQMEDTLDTFDIYVFENWYKGEVVEGPKVRRYWFDFTLRYPHDQRPDPKGAHRLMKHDIRVSYEEVTVEEEDEQDREDQQLESKPTHWDVTISIPRRLLSDMNAGELELYDDEVEIEDIQDAQDHGMNDETGYVDDGKEGDDFFGGLEDDQK